jgi:hypothetical protein
MRTEMPGIESPSARQDEATVAAVRGGCRKDWRICLCWQALLCFSWSSKIARRGWTTTCSPDMALFTCILLPETNLFTPHGLQMMHESIFNGADPQAQDKSRNLGLGEAPLAKRALLAGWIGWPDLNLTPEDISKEIHQDRTSIISAYSAWSAVENLFLRQGAGNRKTA